MKELVKAILIIFSHLICLRIDGAMWSQSSECSLKAVTVDR